MRTGFALAVGYLAGAATVIAACLIHEKLGEASEEQEVITFADIRKKKEYYTMHESPSTAVEAAEDGEEPSEGIEKEPANPEPQAGKSAAAEKANRPYFITSEEFYDCADLDYDQMTLIYYADGVLCDELDVPVENVSETVGDEFASYFGIEDDDEINIRNDARKTDYIVLRSAKTYDEVLAMKPFLR